MRIYNLGYSILIFLIIFFMFTNHISTAKSTTYFHSPESSTNIPVESKKLTEALLKYPDTKAYEALENGKTESITDANIADKKLLLTAVQHHLKEGSGDQKFLQRNILMLQLQGAITQYEGNVLATKMNNIKAGLSNPEGTGGLNIHISSPNVDNNGNFSQPINSEREFNFSDPQLNSLQDKQSAEIQAIDKHYNNDRSKLVATHTTEIRSEYIGTNAYRVLKSGKFDTITPENMEKAKELLIASQDRLNSIGQDRPGYQDMLSRTDTLRKNISKMELKQTEAMLKSTLKGLV